MGWVAILASMFDKYVDLPPQGLAVKAMEQLRLTPIGVLPDILAATLDNAADVLPTIECV